MKTILLKCFIAFAGLMATSHAATTTPVVDQAYESYGGYGSVSNQWRQAQTFVTGVTGKLVRVEIALRPGAIRDLSSSAEANLAITRTQDRVPLALPSEMLASSLATFPNADFDPMVPLQPLFVHQFLWVPFDFDPVDVTVGDELAIVMSPLLPHGYQWAQDFPGNYAGGEGYTGPPADLSHPRNYNETDYLFRTYVIPIPEPSSLVAGLIAAVVLYIWNGLSRTSRLTNRCTRSRGPHGFSKSMSFAAAR